ncbi:MAG: DEAD/DEAH box helicase [Clostridiales bacterium]|nr:DEAD/DEAH box helicase [Clostridiales bacterium]
MQQKENGENIVKENVVKEVVKEIENTLLPYQKASVDAICGHFAQNNRALLADEVGLGKTYIAKGVVAKMALRHWENQKEQDEKRPFRVAYICPNQNVANQNYPKFKGMYPDNGLGSNEKKKEILTNALEKYKNTNREEQIKQKKHIKQKKQIEQIEQIKNFLATSSVYTRLCEWLIKLYDGDTIQIAMDSDSKGLYLRGDSSEKGKVARHSESGVQDSRLKKTSPTVTDAALTLMKEILACAELPILNTYWRMACTASEAECLKNYKQNNEDIRKKLPGVFYNFNKMAAQYLASQTVEDYRLSMQHLYTLENQRNCSEKAIQFECLTPSTSFNIGNGTGTYQERALIYATLKYYLEYYERNQISELPGDLKKMLKGKFEMFKGKKNNKEEFVAAYEVYQERLKDLDPNNLIPMEGWGDACNRPDDFIKHVRNLFIKNNVEHFLNYDLVIMDEFQNFSDLLQVTRSNVNQTKEHQNEAGIIAEKLFGKENCKVLLLSATPFSVQNYIPDGYKEEDEGEGIDERSAAGDEWFADFENLVRFMKKGNDSAEWMDEWKKHRQDAEACRKLMHEIGIFRTERNAAAKHSPILEKSLSENLVPDFTRCLQTNLFMNENSKYRSAYGYTTPYPLVFGRGYEFSKMWSDNVKCDNKAIDPKYQNLFLRKEDLAGTKIETGHIRFETLKRSLFLAASEHPTPTPASMLWIPPCNHEKPLEGAFKGREGYSKTLIFSHFRMTPLAFTYLLCNEAAYQIKQNNEGAYSDEVEEKLEEFFNNAIEAIEAIEEKTKDQLKKYFVGLFESPVGKAAVRSIYRISTEYPNTIEGYCKAVAQYCEDGCFCDMIKEYVELLKNEYGNRDADMAQAVRRARGLRIAIPKLNLKENNEIKQMQLPAANRFAVGLFPENDNGSDLRTRMANIKGAFNSPFWPFVFTTTSIGAEGIDLHWYARNIVHWDVPSRPLDIEQREGRIMRYRCHAYRLNEKKEGKKEEDCVKEAWKRSGMHETQLNYFSEKEEECYHVVRQTCFLPGSGEQQCFEEEKRIIGIYRKVLGTANEKELIDGGVTDGNELPELDLSPWIAKHKSSDVGDINV